MYTGWHWNATTSGKHHGTEGLLLSVCQLRFKRHSPTLSLYGSSNDYGLVLNGPLSLWYYIIIYLPDLISSRKLPEGLSMWTVTPCEFLVTLSMLPQDQVQLKVELRSVHSQKNKHNMVRIPCAVSHEFTLASAGLRGWVTLWGSPQFSFWPLCTYLVPLLRAKCAWFGGRITKACST